MPGDLVQFSLDDSLLNGVVIDVWPANIYDKEICTVLVEGSLYKIGSLSMRTILEAPNTCKNLQPDP